MSQTIRITKAQISRVRCGRSHSGPTKLSIVGPDRTYAQCDGCGTTYSAEQVVNAGPGIPGSGGVILQR